MSKKLKLLLIVNDPSLSRRLNEEIIQVPGYEAAVTYAGLLADGLAHLDREPVDLVLLDLDLPDCRGKETALRLRRRFTEVPVIALIEQADTDLVSALLRTGIQEYLIKGMLRREGRTRSLCHILELTSLRKTLKEREERYRALSDAIDDGYCVIELAIHPNRPLDCRFLEVNRAFEKQTALRDVDGKWMRALLPDTEEEWYEIYRDVAQTGKPIRFERCGRALNHRCFSVHAFRLDPPERQRIAVLFRDVTEQKLAERALYESEQRLRLFIEYAPAALAMFDRDMRYLSASRRWRQEFCPGEGELVGRPAYEVHDIPERWKEVHRRGLAGEVLGAEEECYMRQDGSTRWARWEIRPWRQVSGEVGGIVIFTEDITQRKMYEEQMQLVNQELSERIEERTRELKDAQCQYLHAEKLSAMGKLSASIAHEFNNPLQGIMTILKGLQHASTLEEEDREMLEVALAETERMKNLIRNLQEFNRPSSGRRESMDLHAGLNTMLLLCKSEYRRKNIRTELHFAENLPRITAIPDQIKQVFLNLLNNAADAIEHDGVITIRTWQEGRHVAVAIEDTGTGIAPELIDLIFQPFYSTKPEIKGSGLGLSVCRGIVRNHHGEIRVVSEPGQGATFTVLLPVDAEEVNNEEVEKLTR